MCIRIWLKNIWKQCNKPGIITIKGERIDKTNQSIINFCSTIKKSRCIINKNSKIFGDLTYLSQAYVFYKLSQTQVSNLDFKD